MRIVLPAVTFLLFTIAVAAPGQTSAPADIAAAKRGIAAGNSAYIAAFRKADAKGLSQVYDPTGARLNEGGEVARGRGAIAEDVGKFVAKVGPVRVTLDSKEV